MNACWRVNALKHNNELKPCLAVPRWIKRKKSGNKQPRKRKLTMFDRMLRKEEEDLMFWIEKMKHMRTSAVQYKQAGCDKQLWAL